MDSSLRVEECQNVFDQRALAGSVGTGDAQIVASVTDKEISLIHVCPVITEGQWSTRIISLGHFNPFFTLIIYFP
jgi:hypothetical protein